MRRTANYTHFSAIRVSCLSYALRFNHFYENNSTYGGRQVNMRLHLYAKLCYGSICVSLAQYVQCTMTNRFREMMTPFSLHSSSKTQHTARTQCEAMRVAKKKKKRISEAKMKWLRCASQVNIHFVKVFRLTTAIKTGAPSSIQSVQRQWGERTKTCSQRRRTQAEQAIPSTWTRFTSVF